MCSLQVSSPSSLLIQVTPARGAWWCLVVPGGARFWYVTHVVSILPQNQGHL